MAFGQLILEMEVLVTEALRNTVDYRCSSETLQSSPCPFGQTTIEILQFKLYCSDKINNVQRNYFQFKFQLFFAIPYCCK